jgi:hypothetical protein
MADDCLASSNRFAVLELGIDNEGASAVGLLREGALLVARVCRAGLPPSFDSKCANRCNLPPFKQSESKYTLASYRRGSASPSHIPSSRWKWTSHCLLSLDRIPYARDTSCY